MKIISGGQTGVDRGALDAAIELDIAHGGWCPKGRRAEFKTIIPEKYLLKETDSEEYSERTILNIRDSDGTFIIVPKMPLAVTDGTILTIQTVKEKNKPYLIIVLSKEYNSEQLLAWVNENDIKTLNVAGPRESQAPGIYLSSFTLLRKFFFSLLNTKNRTDKETPALSTHPTRPKI